MATAKRGFLRWWGAGIDFLAGFAVFVLMLVLFYFGSPGRLRSVDVGFWITASVVVALLALGLSVAVSQRRWAAIIVYPIVGLVVVGTILLFAFPNVDLNPDVDYPPNPYACTRTDSENCPGG